METFVKTLLSLSLFQTLVVAAQICVNMTSVQEIILNDGSKIPAIGKSS
jgi:hypothetical protein